MFFPDSSESTRCRVARATESDVNSVSLIFDENEALMKSAGVRVSSRQLAEETIFNKDLPPEGKSECAISYLISSKANGCPLGIIEIYVGHPNDTCVWIGRLFLRRPAQRMQYGSEIVSDVETIAKRNGMDEFRIAVNVPNWGALWFWSRVGYTRICGVHGPASPPNGMLVLSKDLR